MADFESLKHSAQEKSKEIAEKAKSSPKTGEIAENLQKGGGFIPGIRPGSQTEKYLTGILNRITLAGAVFLGLIAVLPSFFQNVIGVANLAIGGTGILIVVSVVLEMTRDLEAQLVMKRYESFLR